MTPAAPPTAPLDHLADRIHAGEVVFFVGAGFSIDSEGLSSELIIKRLLLRLAAFDRLQGPPATPGTPGALQRLASVFGIADSLTGINATIASAKTHKLESHLTRLASRYYELNSWLCQAFGELFLGATATTHDAFTAGLQAAEAAALAESQWDENAWYRDRLAFTKIPEAWWNHSRPVASLLRPPADAVARLGKLVFIHSTGLFDAGIMSGPGYDPQVDPDCLLTFAHAYGDRLRPRHHVIARLAREGLCPTVVTTNFDLLLEGAFRLSGFRSALPGTRPPMPTSLPRFDVIASPEAFFTRGKAYRTTTVVKLHGCAGQLRKDPDQFDSLTRYLPQLVYTYREIQNWRDDSWAAEFLRTLLRTRTFVFSGYSTADPVLHDTFRSVYEEMARKLGDDAPAPAPGSSAVPASPGVGAATPPTCAPAYFLAYSANDRAQEFHANEVLSSASRAIGAGALSLGRDHPNYLRFAPEWNSAAGRLKLDEMMLWLQHRVLRRQQTEALRNELPGFVSALLGRRPQKEMDELGHRFKTLLATEAADIQATLIAPGPAFFAAPEDERKTRISAARRQLTEATAWSHGFHPALRREWAHASALLRSPATFRAFAELQHPLWYYPASERADWTAWSAVLELALRRLGPLAIARWNGLATPPDEPSVVATLAPKPTVLIKRHAAASAPLVALTLQIRDHSRRVARRPDCPGFPARHAIWTIPEEAVPWQRPPDAPDREPEPGNPYRLGRPYRIGSAQWSALPSARLIWDLAVGHPFDPKSETVRLLIDCLLGP